jgi:hypothetical protein
LNDQFIAIQRDLPGIIDVNLRKIQGQSWCFTPTHYWSLPDGKGDTMPKHIEHLHKALDLGGQLRRL